MSERIRKAIDEAYYIIALYMPLWWQWQWQFVMDARFYFEARHVKEHPHE